MKATCCYSCLARAFIDLPLSLHGTDRPRAVSWLTRRCQAGAVRAEQAAPVRSGCSRKREPLRDAEVDQTRPQSYFDLAMLPLDGRTQHAIASRIPQAYGNYFD